MLKPNTFSVYIEAENFHHKGGWTVDQQFMDLMGSPYLLAHGLGGPVDDAETTVEFPSSGDYTVFVRTYNWTSPWSNKEGPGGFALLVDGQRIGPVLGTFGSEWMWQKAGIVNIAQSKARVTLRDLSGFDGRVDAIYFTQHHTPPPNTLPELEDFKEEKAGLSPTSESAGDFDFVVTGGGIAGITSAVAAARLGLRVALIHDRPVLGGNNSSEVRVHLGGRINQEPYPALGDVVKEIGPSQGGNAQPADFYENEKKLEIVQNEENISLFTKCRVINVKMSASSISEVHASHLETGKVLSFSAPLFADCTGDGSIGYLAGADYTMGRESRHEFNEPTAPEKSDKMTMGSSVQWYSTEEEEAVEFPDFQYGVEFNDETVEKITKGDWNWETGMNRDQIREFEYIRDYGLLVVYSNWSWLKNYSSVKDVYRNRRLAWVAAIAGKRESRRLLGDFILKEQDITECRNYPDASVPTTWTIDLHYPDPKNSELFPGREFKSIAKHQPIYPYPIPYRCLYSRNIDNLFMAGRNISVTHIALGTVRVMRTTGMMGEVVGIAAAIATRDNTTPRGVYQYHLEDLQALMREGVGKYEVENKQEYNLGKTLA